jgi:hypothetical protein
VKKIILIILTISCSIGSFAQSKTETKEWIKRKSNFHSYQSIYPRYMEFDKDQLIYFTKIGDKPSYAKILINQISQYSIEFFEGPDNNNGYKINLFCKDKSKCIEQGSLIDEKLIPNERPHINYVFSIYLDESFSKDELPIRMEKAIKALVKAYGGNATKFKDTF